ncbi:MAG: VTT domain-containing protein [bacterium]|nr:VTT domain-containing protein [bacterium]
MFDIESIIQVGGVLGVAAIVFAESGLFFGFFLPGDSLLFTAGFLASQGVIPIIPLVICAVIAAILGDSVGYWFGRKVGPMIFTRPDSRWFSRERLGDARIFFEKHGPKSIILARFIPAVRTFTPILAGVGQMRYAKFLAYNVIGGLLWAGLLPLVGYFLVAVIPGAERFVSVIIIGIIIVSALPIAIPLAKELLAMRK